MSFSTSLALYLNVIEQVEVVTRVLCLLVDYNNKLQRQPPHLSSPSPLLPPISSVHTLSAQPGGGRLVAIHR